MGGQAHKKYALLLIVLFWIKMKLYDDVMITRHITKRIFQCQSLKKKKKKINWSAMVGNFEEMLKRALISTSTGADFNVIKMNFYEQSDS